MKKIFVFLMALIMIYGMTAFAEESDDMKIMVTDGVREIVFALNGTPAAQSLYAQLPIETEVENYGGNEKIFYPPQKLDGTDAVESGGEAGGLAYFSPWGNVVMYYGSFDSYPGLYVLGDAVSGADQIGALSGTLRISRYDKEEAVVTECLIPASMGDLYGVLQIPAGERPFPLVILSHGFGGNHIGNQDYADWFFANGFAVFNLDFCGGGWGSKSVGSMQEMSVLTEAEDLNAVIDYFRDDPRFSKIFLWGASQGGFVSSYVAAGRPDDVAALVIEFPAYVLQDDAKKRAAADGSFPETTAVMGMTIGRIYSTDAVSFDIYDVIGAYTGDVLILHGDRDMIVPLSYSERAAQVFPNAELVVMPGQGHGFMGASRGEAMKRELAFLQAHQ